MSPLEGIDILIFRYEGWRNWTFVCNIFSVPSQEWPPTSVPGIFGIHFKDFHTLTLWVSGIRLESILKIPIYLPIVFETTNVVLHS